MSARLAQAEATTSPSESRAPRFGLRFDRGRTELVLDAPLVLESGVRVEKLRSELVPREGRFSLTEGWRAFRHRRATLLEIHVSIGLRSLATALGAAVGGEVRLVPAEGPRASLALSSELFALAVELAWGWDGEDLLLVLEGARAFPRTPRPAIALAHDLAGGLARFDVERGVLRVERPLRAILQQALVPAGVRVPSASGLALRASIEGERLVIVGERVPGGRPEPAREALERARARAASLAACLDGGPAPEDDRPVVALAEALASVLDDERASAESVMRAAEELARRERHAVLASTALLAAAERVTGDADRAASLARAALERGGLSGPTEIARAIELAAARGAAGAPGLPWEELGRALEGEGPTVLRARGLALEGAGRLEGALHAFAEALRAGGTDVLASTGLARVLSALGRHDEAISAWDRVAESSRGEGALVAKLHAAESALAAGHVDGAHARLRAIVAAHAGTVVALRAHVVLARSSREPLAIDRGLSRLTDALGAADAEEAAVALREAIGRALAGGDAALAEAEVQALERTLGEAGAGELAMHRAAIAQTASRSLSADDAAQLRTRADELRRAGKLGEAARVMVELFGRTQDAAVLRAAIELADRAETAAARLAVFDRALELLPPGPARDAIRARR
ncbi:MAG: tetratricopeptide repeat protein [Sandaracinus sp.]